MEDAGALRFRPILDMLHFTCREVVGELTFTDDTGGRPLVVQGHGGRKCRHIRLELSEEQYFHLKRVRIYVNIGESCVDIAPICEIRLSSVMPGSEALAESNAIVGGDDDGSPFGFHTDLEERPSITLTLPYATMVERIVVTNRADEWAYRALSLRVLDSMDGQAWHVLHDNGMVLRAIRARLDLAVSRFPEGPASRPALEMALEMMWGWYVGELFRTETAWGAYAHGQDRTAGHRAVIDYMNACVLSPHQQELTSHGLRRSFRFWSAAEKQDYLRFAESVVVALEHLSDCVCLGYGSILGIMRQQDLLPHDDDIDIIIALPREAVKSLPDALSRVGEHLRQHDFEVLGDFASHRWVARGPSHVDVFVGVIEDDFLSFFPGPRRGIRRDVVFPPARADVLGVEVQVPRNADIYLEAIYGKDWRTPSTSWRHSWNTVDFDDLLR